MSTIQITLTFQSATAAAAFLASIDNTPADTVAIGTPSTPAPSAKKAATKAVAKATAKKAEKTGDFDDRQAELQGLGRDDLKSLADELGIDYSAKTRTNTLIDLILAAEQESDDEQEQDDDEPESDDDETETDDESDDEQDDDVADDDEQESDDLTPSQILALGKKADKDDDDAAYTLTDLANTLGLDPNEYETWAALAAAINDENGDESESESDDDESDDDESEQEAWTKADLDEMSLGELKSLARDDFDLPTRGLDKPTLIKAILKAQG